jgi:hypothetical protein
VFADLPPDSAFSPSQTDASESLDAPILEPVLELSSPARSAPSSPLARAIAQPSSPIAPTVWRSPLVTAEPRRSSRLIAADPQHFISIVDKAVLRKQKLNEGEAKPQRRRGELDAEDLLAVAVEDGRPLPPRDALVLAAACDNSPAALGLEPSALPLSSP